MLENDSNDKKLWKIFFEKFSRSIA